MLSFGAMKRLRWVVVCAALAAAAPSASPRQAEASVSIAITFDALVRASSAVVVGTATEERTVWEGGRIYTYSHIHVDSAVAGELAENGEAWVRTMGGIVGKVGQIVDGEPVFTVGRPSLVFLHRSSSGPFVVTARAQGQFGIYADEQSRLRLRRSNAVGALVSAASDPKADPTRTALAGDIIHGRAVTDATLDIATAWSRAHAP
jgi:hypothetical protein